MVGAGSPPRGAVVGEDIAAAFCIGLDGLGG